MTRKERGRGFANFEDCIDVTILMIRGIHKRTKQILTAAAKLIEGQTETQWNLKNKNNKKDYIDTSSDKLGILYTKWPVHGHVEEISREKLNWLCVRV